MLNSIQLQYKLLQALEAELGIATITEQYGTTSISFLVNDGTQRATIKTEINALTLCTVCSKEIISPSYKQKTHAECTVTDTDN